MAGDRQDEFASRASSGRSPAACVDEHPVRARRLRRLLRWLLLLLVSYGAVVLLAMWCENLLIFPTWQIPAGDWELAGIDHEPVWFEAGDRTRLHGWFFPLPEARAAIVYFHGNGEDLSHLGEYMHGLRQRYQVAVFAFDYRGYGRSEGRPHERGLIADGLAAQRWLATRLERAPQDIVLWGRSIGGAVAVQVAVDQGARGLILERTFTSLPDVAARHYRWLPVRWLMRNRFDSRAVIGQYAGPLLQAHGTADEIVPLQLGKQLFAAATQAQPRTFLPMPGVSHNSPAAPAFTQAVRRFFADLSSVDELNSSM